MFSAFNEYFIFQRVQYVLQWSSVKNPSIRQIAIWINLLLFTMKLQLYTYLNCY